jgi:hypothetical protein
VLSHDSTTRLLKDDDYVCGHGYQVIWVNCMETNRDTADVLRHIIKNVSSRLVDTMNPEGHGRHYYACTN